MTIPAPSPPNVSTAKSPSAGSNGDNGEYSLLLGTAKGIDGPYTKGTYLWSRSRTGRSWKRRSSKAPISTTAPASHGDVVARLYEACKYIGVKPDLYDDNDEEIKAYLRGE